MKKQSTASKCIIYAVLIILTVLFAAPIAIVLMNSFKGKFDILSSPFTFPNENSFVGFENYISGITQSGLLWSFLRSVFITLASVTVIIIATAMCAWYIVRSKSRFCRILYYAFVFSMIVPFQMVMFTMTYIVSTIHFNNIFGIIAVYLGFGAGLSVFMISGFVKGVPLEIEEAATIDGCNPLQTFFMVVLPLLKPTVITVAILNAMWIWNDYLLPYLILGTRSKTLPVAIQIAMQGAYGATDWGGVMAMLVMAILPIIIFYLAAQRHIISGVVAGAVKG